jgi:hypothetical protein
MKKEHHWLILGGIALLVYWQWSKNRGGSVQPAGNLSSMSALQTISPVALATRGFGYPSGRPSCAYIPPATVVPFSARNSVTPRRVVPVAMRL